MIIDELRELLGEALLQRFLTIFGGTPVTFSKRGKGAPFEQIARVIGEDAARGVCRRFAGQKLYIPRSIREERERRNAEIAARLAAGESPNVIARSYRTVQTITARHVRRIGATATKRRPITEPAE
jgi:hypothetical protein